MSAGGGDRYAKAAIRAKAAATIASRLTFEAVERWYEDKYALSGVSLDIAPSEVVCLLGPSGCGKTTLLRIAAGIEKPSRGRVLLDGLEVAGPERFVLPEKRNVGLMFQDFALFPHLTILQNVAFGLKSLERSEAKRVAMGLLARVGLERYARDYPHILSGGEQQRVALARAIAPRPGVLLMDEPFSGLDVALRHAMQEEMLAILRETRATAVIVTHDPDEAMRMADRIAVMRRGRVIREGAGPQLYRDPGHLYVARLFSELNELSGRVLGGAVEMPFGRIAAPGLEEGAAVVVALRQQDVTVAPVGTGRAGRVVATRFLGDAAILDLAVEGFEETLRARIRGSEAPARGEDVGLLMDPADAMVFAETRPE
ncbi:MAG: ABC transporter ATP-binding protein [Hyphomicrobiaceae bacterium]